MQLTGTPLQNNIGELFMLMHFLEPKKFESQEEFERQFSDLSGEQQVVA
jgi:SNF2 family DNA or RNA helicase